jgi:hypothetical protein
MIKYTILISTLLTTILITNSFANNFKEYIIKNSNKIVKIQVKEENNQLITSNDYIFNNSSTIQIRFNNITPNIIKEFEKRYNLKLKNVLVIGDYIYKHNSKDILKLIEEIVNNQDDNIIHVKPSWAIPMMMY